MNQNTVGDEPTVFYVLIKFIFAALTENRHILYNNAVENISTHT